MEKIPIIRLGEFLLVSMQTDIYDRLAMELQDELAAMIAKTKSCGVLIDISCLEIVDSFMCRMFNNIAIMSKLLGAEVVLVGMQPAVAITITEFGLTLEGVYTALNVDKGMALLNSVVYSKKV